MKMQVEPKTPKQVGARWGARASKPAAALSALLISAAIGPAQAADIDVTGWTFGSGHSVNVESPTYNGPAGAFSGQLMNAGAFNTANLVTYSVELGESFTLPSLVTGYSIVTGAGLWGAGVSNKVGSLMTYAYSNPTLVDSVLESGALQLAIWNAIYDTDNVVSSGSFRNSTNVGGVNVIANSFISNSLAVTSVYNVSVLTKSGSQDLLLLSPVPEPQALAMALAGLAVLAAVRHRRKG